MKKIALIFSVLFCLASCEKQGTNYGPQGQSGTIFDDNNTSSSIVGAWKLTSIGSSVNQEGYIDPSSGNQVYTSYYDNLEGCTSVPNVYWVFNNNNTLIEYGQYEVFDNEFMWDTIAYTYAYEGNSLEIFDSESGLSVFDQITINVLNSSTFDFDAYRYTQYQMGDTIYISQINVENARFTSSTLPQIDNPRLSLKKNNLFFKKEK
tara:strand:- start:112 stop:729 length:618 start_codon:yes stop_codon:yes gene_type:complete